MTESGPLQVPVGYSKVPTGVGWTSLLTAYGRAQESRQAAGLFGDPLASLFIGAVSGADAVDDGVFPRRT